MTFSLDQLAAALSGRYDIERELTIGGMARLYLAQEVKHRRKVVIKVLKPELTSAIGAERFLREIEIIARLTHPHILAMLDSGDANGALFYAMPYIAGDTLRQRLSREGQMPIADAVRITCEVAGALHYAHSEGIVHRDIKPENILLSEGQAVVADFGIARVFSEAENLTGTGIAIGTPQYMSPEQASADRELDGRSDIYSLACVLYEMLAGEPPFTGPNAQVVIAKRLSQPPPSVRIIREGVPKELDKTLRRALSRAPTDRYGSADEFRLALEAVGSRKEASRSLEVSGGGKAGRVATPARPKSAKAVRSLAVLPFRNLSSDPEQEYFVDAMHDAILGQLAQIAAVRVVSRTSVARYKATDKSIAEIARELEVDAVMEGSVVAADETVRIHVELIQALPTERRLWGQTYDRNLQDVLSLHSDVARAIADEIRVTVTPEERNRLDRSRIVNPEAYRQYLMGAFKLNQFTEAAFRSALKHFELAIELDPAYAAAYAGKAVAYIELGSWASSLPPSAVRADANAASRTAVELDPMLADGYIARGQIKQLFEWDFAGAEADYNRGVSLNPRSGHSLNTFSNYLMTLCRFEQAADVARRAADLDPLNGYCAFLMGWAYDHMGRDAEALDQYHKGLELAPYDASMKLELSQFHGERGRHDEAARYAAQAESILGMNAAPAWYGRLGYDYAIARRPDDARRILDHLKGLSQRQYVGPLAFAVIHGALGEVEAGLEYLEEGYEKRDVVMVWIKARHQFDAFRGYPRFEDLMRRMTFPV